MPAPPQRMSGQRSAEVRDAMAEMAERAQLISQEAGTKIATAMKDVIAAAAGITGFAVESARDLVQYMVRRGQMTQDEADKLVREAEEAQRRRSPERRSTAAKAASSERASTAKAREVTREEPKQTASSEKRASASTAAKPEKKPAASRTNVKKASKDAAPKKKR
ncbi:MAG TPA: hypothetical protein VGJ18_04725 [Gemmatimonadaceae bacterium]